MGSRISAICIPMIFNLGSVNCYLIHTQDGFILVDTGLPAGRKQLEDQLGQAGCQPGSLRLILLTHGDFDHMGSAAYLRQKFGAKIAMHPDDWGMAERADMFWNRGKDNRLLRGLIPALFGFRKGDRFTPDLALQDGQDLSAYGWDARVVALPGHSKGSVGFLTREGDLICGDLWMNDKTDPYPGYGDPAAFIPSFDKVKSLDVRMIYPGHGKPFSTIPQV